MANSIKVNESDIEKIYIEEDNKNTDEKTVAPTVVNTLKGTKKFPNIKFSKVLKDLIEERDITQLYLSEILEITPASINAYMKKKSLPSVLVLENMSDFFGVSTDYLLGRVVADSKKDNSREDEFKLKINELELEIQRLSRELYTIKEETKDKNIIAIGEMLIIKVNQDGKMEVLTAK